MQKRHFLKQLLAGSASLALAPSAWLVGRPPGRHYLWVHARPEWTRDQWRRRCDQVRAAGLHGLLTGGGPPAIEAILGPAAEAGLEVHAWEWTLNQPGEVALRQQHPEYFSLSRSGKSCATDPPYVDYYRWLCPSRLPVRDLITAKMARLAQYTELASIHLDYVRHPDVILPLALQPTYGLIQDREYPDYDFCYCQVCRERFVAQGGQDPLTQADPTQDPAWRQYRWQAVTEVVAAIAAVVHARGLALTAAVFPTPTLARQLVRQAWDTWPIDGVFPMLYQNFYGEDLRWIRQAVRAGRRALPTDKALYAGLFLPALPPADLADAIAHARAGGASGIALFDLKGLSEAHWPVIQAALAAWS